MSRADEYIQAYKELEKVARDEFKIDIGKSVSYELRKKAPYNRYDADIDYCTQVRNLLQHGVKVNGAFAVEPNDEMIGFLRSLIERIKNRKRCKDIQIGLNAIFSCENTSKVKDVMNVMRKNTFTHVPILENNKVVGVFDENALFTYLSDQEIVDLDDLTIGELKKYTSEFQREMEEFLFVKNTQYIDVLQDTIQKEANAGKRVGAIFVTLTGKQDGNLCGLITPWDMIGV